MPGVLLNKLWAIAAAAAATTTATAYPDAPTEAQELAANERLFRAAVFRLSLAMYHRNDSPTRLRELVAAATGGTEVQPRTSRKNHHQSTQHQRRGRRANAPSSLPTPPQLPEGDAGTDDIRSRFLYRQDSSMVDGAPDSDVPPPPPPPAPPALPAIPLDRARSRSVSPGSYSRSLVVTATSVPPPPVPLVRAPSTASSIGRPASVKSSISALFSRTTAAVTTGRDPAPAPVAGASPSLEEHDPCADDTADAAPTLSSSLTRTSTAWLLDHLPRSLMAKISPMDEHGNWFDGIMEEDDWDWLGWHDPATSLSSTGSSLTSSTAVPVSGGTLAAGEAADAGGAPKNGALPGDHELAPDLWWRMDKLIGAGVVGMVYLGQLIQPAPAPPITVAIKHLHLPTANPHLNRQNFQQLIATLSLANHPNVISYYGSHIVDEDCFLFLEYCSGGTLAEYLATNGPVTSKSQLAQWVHDAAAGLAYLHRSGVVHRDIKPSNIMIQDGKLKLTDLSSAKMHGACCPEVHDSKMAGTPAYLAPELVTGTVSKTHPTGAQDVWSLGCVIYELVVGSQPFADIDNVWSLYFLLGQYSRLHAASRASRAMSVKSVGRSSSTIDPSRYPLPPSPMTTPENEDGPSSGSGGGGGSPMLDSMRTLWRRVASRSRSLPRFASSFGGAGPRSDSAMGDSMQPDADMMAHPISVEPSLSDRSAAAVGDGGAGIDEEPVDPYPLAPSHHPLLSRMCAQGGDLGADPEVLDLAAQCLRWDPETRWTAEKMLMHPMLRRRMHGGGDTAAVANL